MTNSFSIAIEKTYPATLETIYNLFKDSTVFKLTGASDLHSDFRSGGAFKLTFNKRGVIDGLYININENSLYLEWNVKGFERPDEIKTLLEIQMVSQGGKCVVKLFHTNIVFEEAAQAKAKAWNEILVAIEKLIGE